MYKLDKYDSDSHPLCLHRNKSISEEILEDPNIYFEIKKKKLPYECSFKYSHNCDKVFKEKGNLKTHERVHTGEKPYRCNFPNCQRKFITMGNLKSHEANHTGNKKYVCTYQNCNKKYYAYTRLQTHIRTHEGKKPFVCNFKGCGKSFNEKGNLKTHYRIHTGEKPYECKFEGCTKSFKAQGHLKDHLNRHQNLKPYKCDLCGAKFSRTSTLKIHKHTHTKEKPFECKDCGKKFSEKGNMSTHRKKTHFNFLSGNQIKLQENSVNYQDLVNTQDSHSSFQNFNSTKSYKSSNCVQEQILHKTDSNISTSISTNTYSINQQNENDLSDKNLKIETPTNDPLLSKRQRYNSIETNAITPLIYNNDEILAIYQIPQKPQMPNIQGPLIKEMQEIKKIQGFIQKESFANLYHATIQNDQGTPQTGPGHESIEFYRDKVKELEVINNFNIPIVEKLMIVNDIKDKINGFINVFVKSGLHKTSGINVNVMNIITEKLRAHDLEEDILQYSYDINIEDKNDTNVNSAIYESNSLLNTASNESLDPIDPIFSVSDIENTYHKIPKCKPLDLDHVDDNEIGSRFIDSTNEQCSPKLHLNFFPSRLSSPIYEQEFVLFK